MTIKQLLEMPTGKEHRTGGFELTIKKYPSKMVEVGKKFLQPVVFIDETGEEINGDVLLAKRIPLQKGYKIHIMVAWLLNGAKGKKLFVEQWWLPTMSVAEYEAKQYDFTQEMKYGEPLNIVKSKCCYGLVRDFRALNDFADELPESVKEIIESDINYITRYITNA